MSPVQQVAILGVGRFGTAVAQELTRLGDAVEAIDGAGGNVSIKLSNADANSVQVEIADSGCGIAAEDISKVFEPYFSTKDTGTGLGLAIVKKAVDDHGGTISVASKEGSGTTFTIILPAKEN